MANFRAGAARSCITPRIGCHICGYFNDRIATGIRDELYAKALVLENDSTSIAIVVCDLIALVKADIDIAKERASQLTGIPSSNIFVAATHTHYGPATVAAFGTPRDDVYMADAMLRAADSVKLAQGRLTEAEAGIASTAVVGETFNRRWHLRDGRVEANFRLGHLNPDAIRPAGPTDPEVLVLVVRGKERRPIALLANYSLHYVGGPYDYEVSADYFGHFDRALQRLAGCQFVGIMANGCCGDVNNIDIARPQPDTPYPTFQAERVANVLAGAAYSAWQGLRDFDYDRDPVLGAATEMLNFRRRQSTAVELEEYQRITSALMPDVSSPHFQDWIYARERLLVEEEPLECQTPVMALRVGDLGIVGMGGEMFVEYGLQIKARSPFKHTMTVELANDWLGYFPTDKALQEGSYELQLARSAKAAAGIEGATIEAALTALRRLA